MSYQQGNYSATVLQQQFGESEKKGTPYFALTIRPDEMDVGEPEMVSVDSQERTVFIYLTEGTIDFAVRDLAAIGFRGASFAELDPSSPNHHSFVNQKIPVYCKHENYEGKTKEKWQISSGGGSINHKALDKTGVRRLDALFGKTLKAAAKPGNGKATSGAARKPAAAVNDDDIPF